MKTNKNVTLVLLIMQKTLLVVNGMNDSKNKENVKNEGANEEVTKYKKK